MRRTWDDAAAEALDRIVSAPFRLRELDAWMVTLRGAFTDPYALDSLFVRLGAFAWARLDVSEADLVALLARKHHDYGPRNILGFGTPGLIIRLHDKLARAANLERRGGGALNEAAADTWTDVVGYCVCGLMVLDEEFELPLACDIA